MLPMLELAISRFAVALKELDYESNARVSAVSPMCMWLRSRRQIVGYSRINLLPHTADEDVPWAGERGYEMAARSNAKPLDIELVRLVSARCWSLAHQIFMSRRAEVLLYAEKVLGNRRLSERWFIEKAIGLGHCSPCSLLEEARGYELVMEHLYRIDHGVYC